MTVYVALLRALNVGGTGLLSMRELAAMCEALGYRKVKTYIQSGNVVFESAAAAGEVKAALEEVLAAHFGRPSIAIIRTAAEMQRVLEANPFPQRQPNRVHAFFLDEAAAPDAANKVTGRGNEEVVFSGREIFVHFPDGMGRSKLVLPQARAGTARNMNTVATLAKMAREL